MNFANSSTWFPKILYSQSIAFIRRCAEIERPNTIAFFVVRCARLAAEYGKLTRCKNIDFLHRNCLKICWSRRKRFVCRLWGTKLIEFSGTSTKLFGLKSMFLVTLQPLHKCWRHPYNPCRRLTQNWCVGVCTRPLLTHPTTERKRRSACELFLACQLTITWEVVFFAASWSHSGSHI